MEGWKGQGKQSSGAARVKNKKSKRKKEEGEESSMSMESLQWNRRFDAARSYFTSAIDEKGCSRG